MTTLLDEAPIVPAESIEPEEAPSESQRIEAAWADLMASLPRYLPDNRDWVGSAVCASVDPELFFPRTGQPADKAKRICGTCPVQAECLSWALHVESLIGAMPGVYGGLTMSDRNAWRERRCRYDDCSKPLAGAWDRYCKEHRAHARRDSDRRHAKRRKSGHAAA